MTPNARVRRGREAATGAEHEQDEASEDDSGSQFHSAKFS